MIKHILQEWRHPPGYIRLFVLCWTAYFVSYLGRYNYAAAMTEIARQQDFTTAEAGMVVTALFGSYGIFQLVSGVLGDHCNPKVLVGLGVFGCGICNVGMGFASSAAVMAVLWLANGAFNALLWAPVVRLITDYMPPETQRKAILSFSYCTAFGTCLAYVLTSGLIAWLPWRWSFWVPAVVILALAICWWPLIRRVGEPDEAAETVETVETPPAAALPCAERQGNMLQICWRSGLLFLLGGVLLIGVLRDGIMVWVPKSLTDIFGLSTAVSAFMGGALPLVHIPGVAVVKRFGRRRPDDDIYPVLLIIPAAFVGVVLLCFFSDVHPLLSLGLFCVASAFISGVSTVFVSLLPLRFVAQGRVSTVAGLTNALTYAGSALSGVGIGWIVTCWGWRAVFILLVVLCVVGWLLCVAVRPRWLRYSRSLIEERAPQTEEVREPANIP